MRAYFFIVYLKFEGPEKVLQGNSMWESARNTIKDSYRDVPWDEEGLKAAIPALGRFKEEADECPYGSSKSLEKSGSFVQERMGDYFQIISINLPDSETGYEILAVETKKTFSLSL